MAASSKQEIINTLVRLLADRQLDPSQVLPALRSLADQALPPASLSDLDLILDQSDDPALDPLRAHVRQVRFSRAISVHAARKRGEAIPKEVKDGLGDLPLDGPLTWTTRQASLDALARALALVDDWRFIEKRPHAPPHLPAMVGTAFAAEAAAVASGSSIWGDLRPQRLVRLVQGRAGASANETKLMQRLQAYVDRWEKEERTRSVAVLDSGSTSIPQDLDERIFLEVLSERMALAATPAARCRLLDMAACWPTDQIAFILPLMCSTAWAGDRATLILATRFGEPFLADWAKWKNYLANHNRIMAEKLVSMGISEQNRAADLLLTWYAARQDRDPEITAMLKEMGRSASVQLDPDEFVARWQDKLSSEEAAAVAWCEPPPLPPMEEKASVAAVVEKPAPRPVSAPTPKPSAAPAAVPLPEPPKKEAPSWQPKLRQFLVENWYLVLGLIMMIVGCSVLAYYTWNKHWLVRHTLLPGVMIAITFAFAAVASKLEKISARMVGTSAALRAAAIALLPINFLLATRVLDDPQVPAKRLVVSLVLALYILLFGYGLNKWCSAVFAPLGRWLGMPLLLLNLLVVLRPVAMIYPNGILSPEHLLGVGFYAGFLVLAVPMLAFARRSDLRSSATTDRHVPWFLGATLILTYLEVLAWVYGSLRLLPRPVFYSPLVVLAGGLILHIESKVQEVQGLPKLFGRESFLGFAFLLAGVMMSMSDPEMRMLVLWLTAAIWVAHSWAKAHPAQDAIGMILISIACASGAFLENFPMARLPLIGIGAAAFLEFFSIAARQRNRTGMDNAAVSLQVLWLVFAVFSAVWRPWVQNIESPLAPAYVLASAAAFLYRAWRDKAPRWIHIAVVASTLAVVCYDESRATVNLPVVLAGIAWLWIALGSMSGGRFVLSTRSSVAVLCAMMALVVMLYRLFDGEWGITTGSSWLDALVVLGPALLAAAMVAVTFFSRSLLPAYFGVIIMILLCSAPLPMVNKILAPLRPGSGLINSALALASVLACFRLRHSFAPPATDGDPSFGGGQFPMKQSDHRLFTDPLIFLAVYLAALTCTMTLSVNTFRNAFDLRCATGLGVVAVAWTCIGVYVREHRLRAVICLHLGWISLFLSLFLGDLYLAAKPNWSVPTLTTMLIIQALYLIYEHAGRRAPWMRDLMADTMYLVLRHGTNALTVLCIGKLVQGTPAAQIAPLVIFLLVQQVWHGVRAGKYSHGGAFFALCWVFMLAWLAPGEGILLRRLQIDSAVTQTLLLVLAVQAAGILIELAPWRQTMRAFVQPQLILAFFFSAALALYYFDSVAGPMGFSRRQALLLLPGLLLAARSLQSGIAGLLAIGVGYVLLLHGNLRALPTFDERIAMLFAPWRVSALSLTMIVATWAAQLAYRARPALCSGAFALLAGNRVCAPIVYVTGMLLALLAVGGLPADPGILWSKVNTWTCFFSGSALVFAAWAWRVPGVLTAGVVILLAGNVHAVNVHAGDWLTRHGLTGVHVTNIGLLLGLLETAIARRFFRMDKAVSYINRVSMVVAGMILALTMAVYFGNPKLAALTGVRLVVSAAMAYIAALSFRQVARSRPAGLEGNWIESFYHFGVTLALWCIALTIPQLRTPGAALWAMAVPMFYFYARAELDAVSGEPRNKSYVTSAATLGFLVLGLYVFRIAFQLVFFPDESVPLRHYHHHSALVIIAAPILFRLRALGGTPWLSFYAGIALIVGTYFAWTAWPGLSPFTNPIPAAWCALACAHFWILASYERSPVRTLVVRLASLDVREWLDQRHAWGIFTFVAVHVAILWAAIHGVLVRDTMPIAFLVLGAASVCMHMAYQRRTWLYAVLGWIEIAMAVHMDFFTPSYLPANRVIWVILGIWAGLTLVQALLSGWFKAQSLNTLAHCFAFVGVLHVIYHGPSSNAGLLAVAGIGALAALTPVRNRDISGVGDKVVAGSLVWIPTWLTFFSQAAGASARSVNPTEWTVLCTALALLLTGCAALLLSARPALTDWMSKRIQPRLLDCTLALLREQGAAVYTVTLSMVLVVVLPAWIFGGLFHFELRERIMLAGLFALSTAGWLSGGWMQRSTLRATFGVICFVGFVAACRSTAMQLVPGPWRIEYDLWTCLAVSIIFTGGRQLLQGRQPELEKAVAGALVLFPAATIVWAVTAGWGFDPTLLVVAVHSVLWIWAGHDNRYSPFNGLAVAGFVATMLMIFWHHLGIRHLHAYVIPVGAGVLVLLHLFRDRVSAGTRNFIRAVALVAMLGSIGYETLTASQHTFWFHATFLALGASVMALGSWMNVRIYLLLGFAGVIVDLGSIAHQTFVGMDRSLQMTLIGLFVLLVGAGFVVGAIYYKTNREKITRLIESTRTRFSAWE